MGGSIQVMLLTWVIWYFLWCIKDQLTEIINLLKKDKCTSSFHVNDVSES